jgi:hypothetical protein
MELGIVASRGSWFYHRAMKAKLVVVAGTTRAQEFKLKLPAILGRGRSCSVQLPHALVSRQHCEVFEADGKLRVRDLGSLNGTLVDGHKVTECDLIDGQLLNVGTVTFRIEIASDDANAWLAPPSEGGASRIGKAQPAASASGKNLASRSAIGSQRGSASGSRIGSSGPASSPAPMADDQLAAEAIETQAGDAGSPSNEDDLLPPSALPPAARPAAALPAAALPPRAAPAALPPGIPTLPPAASPTNTPSVSPPTVPMAIPGAALAAVQRTGLPVAGVPVAGVPVAGVPVAGVPVAGVPVAGVPVAGVPMAGIPVAGVPGKGVPGTGVPVAGQSFPPKPSTESTKPANGNSPAVPAIPSTTHPSSPPNAAHANTMDADEDLTEFLKSLRK